jgi:protein O-mannosyl-transferase
MRFEASPPVTIASMALALGLSAVIAAVTVLVFHPAIGFGFLNWDDPRNLSVVPGFRGGSATDLKWILTTHVMGHYVPLTWATFALDYALWGKHPAGYHATNVALHAGNAVLCYLIARRLIWAAGGLPGRATEAGAALAALGFAVHPMRAESVAWVTERRDVLSGLFFLLAVLSYLWAVQDCRPVQWRRLWAPLFAFAAALLAKQITIILPVVLVILDVYPLRRWRQEPGAVLWEKVPFGIVGAGGVAMLAWTMASDIGFTPLEGVGAAQRFALLAHAAVYYPIQTLMPIHLSPLHEVPPHIDPWAGRFLAGALGTGALTLAAIVWRRRAPWLGTVWAYSVVSILPVSGLMHAGGQTLVADRYSYLGTLGWFVALGGGLAVVLACGPRRAQGAAAGAAVLVVGAWSWLGFQEVQTWRDGLTLWSTAVTRDPACGQCHSHLALELLNSGRVPEALHQAALGVRLRPDVAMLRLMFAATLERAGLIAEAVSELRAAHRLRPTPQTRGELARMLQLLATRQEQAGRLHETRQTLEEALGFAPDNMAIRVRLNALPSAALH